jgi:hypothetical protein
LLVQKRTKKGHHGDHPEGGSVAQIIHTWPSAFGIALTVDLQPHCNEIEKCEGKGKCRGPYDGGNENPGSKCKKISFLDFQHFT